MTDASHPVTQRTTEAFAKSYLRLVGASIREEGQRWHVQLPSHVSLDFLDKRTFELHLDVDENEVGDDQWTLRPDSSFARQLLEEVAEQFVVGSVTITDDQIEQEYSYPDWIQESDAQVEVTNFVPYYDRVALCVFVNIEVETVSEYQMELIEAVTVDTNSYEVLPELTSTVLDTMFDPATSPSDSSYEDPRSEPPVDTIEEPINVAQEAAVEAVEEHVKETRKKATRAAEAEFEEYRQLQEQQLDDVQDALSSLTDRIQEIARKIDKTTDQQERVELLQQRKELQSERESYEQDRDEILEKKQTGYRKKRTEIYRRHALEVNTTPVTATFVTYERGELDIQIRQRGRSESIRVPYAVGEGVTGSVSCENCGEELQVSNPIRLAPTTIGCESCVSNNLL